MQISDSLPISNSPGDDGNQSHSKLARSARQFEALMIGEMLKSAREGNSEGWLGSGGDSAAESASGMAEAQFAQAIANKGGFGLAKMIEHSVGKKAEAVHSVPSR
jgi:Rod binding domain-containing protein